MSDVSVTIPDDVPDDDFESFLKTYFEDNFEDWTGARVNPADIFDLSMDEFDSRAEMSDFEIQHVEVTPSSVTIHYGFLWSAHYGCRDIMPRR